MWNARLDEAQDGIKISGRNIITLKYSDDTTFMAESKKELKSLLMKMKEKSEKVGLILNIQKNNIMASSPITSWHIDGETVGMVFSSVQSLSRVRLFVTPWITAYQASLSITISRSSLRLTSIESLMPSSHLILGRPLLLLPPIPPSISLFQWVSSSHEVAIVLGFQL